jgi:hypothetical protein
MEKGKTSVDTKRKNAYVVITQEELGGQKCHQETQESSQKSLFFLFAFAANDTGK